MKLTTPFTILNRKSNRLNLIRDAITNRRLATEKLHYDYRKIYKNLQFAYWTLMDYFKLLWNNEPNEVIGVGMSIFILLGIYIALLNTYK